MLPEILRMQRPRSSSCSQMPCLQAPRLVVTRVGDALWERLTERLEAEFVDGIGAAREEPVGTAANPEVATVAAAAR